MFSLQGLGCVPNTAATDQSAPEGAAQAGGSRVGGEPEAHMQGHRHAREEKES